MYQVATISGSAAQEGCPRSAARLVEWLRDLEECHEGGLLSDEDYAVQRAEKLSEILCEHRHLWVAPVAAAGSLAIVAGCTAWIFQSGWQVSGLAAALGGLFGLVMLARPCRENLKEAQIRERLEVLNALLAMDLMSADEFLAYEERLDRGGRDLQFVGNL